MVDLEVGMTVKAGSIIVVSAGDYSDYGITGLFKAKMDFVVPGKPMDYSKGQTTIDTKKITLSVDWVEELEWHEAHESEY